MRIELRLYFTYKEHAPGGKNPSFLELDEGVSLAGLLELLRIGQAPDMVTLINGRPAARDALIPPDAVVTIFPPVGGG